MLMLVLSVGFWTMMSRPKVIWPLRPTPTMFWVSSLVLMRRGVLLLPRAPAVLGNTSVPTRMPAKVVPVEGRVPVGERVVVPV
jgi:hypothetical protein